MITGAILVIVPITKCILDFMILDDIIYIAFMYFIIKLAMTIWHIKKGRYN